MWPRSCGTGARSPPSSLTHSPQNDTRMTNNETGAGNALVVSVDHEEWRIYELGPASYDRRGSNTLVFESDGVIRRVRNYPGDWRSLSPRELLALSWTA
jgi:hypothetical protein